MNFRSKLMQFMSGRYGTDPFNRALNILTLVLLILSFIFGRRSALGSLLWMLALACLIYGTFRTFSRNVEKRRRENAKYLQLTNRFRGTVRGSRTRMQQRRDYRFFRCPSCRTWLRVPKGKGKLNITCRQCGERFTRST